MKILKLFLFASLLTDLCAAQPRRMNNPQQFAFGPWTSVYPFNKDNGFNDVSNDALQPSALVTNTESFGSTSDFTAVGAGCTNQTFSVSGNVGTISASAASTCVYLVNGTSWPAPDAMVPLTINQVGAALTSDTLGVGICKNDGSVQILSEYDQVNGNALINVFASSANNPLGTITFSTPVGSSIALGLTSASAIVWYGSSSGGWSVATNASISGVYNPNTDGNLTGFESCFVVSTGAATTTSWQVSNLVSGAGGSPAVGDNATGGILHSVNWIDGRPYTNGSTDYFTATLNDGVNGTNSSGLIAYNLSTGAASIIAKYWVDWSGALNYFGTHAILYDPYSSQYRWAVSAWGLTSPPNNYYGTVAKGTLDMLSSGVHVIPSTDLSQMTLSSGGWDASLACISLNYSTDTCPKWYFYFTTSTGTVADLYTSTSDPSANTWSHTGFSGTPAHPINEGSQIWRTRAANGSSGTTYNALYALNCCATLSAGGNIPASHIYSFTGTPSFMGFATLAPPTSIPASPGHLPLFELGDNLYALSWNNATMNGGPIGQLTMAAAPEAVTSPQMNQVAYVATTGTSSSASITTSPTSISAGCYLVFSAGFNSSGGVSGITITSSPSATWTQIAFYNNSNPDLGQVISMATLPSGSTTFTSTPAVSSEYQAMVVMQVSGTTCTADSTAQTNNMVSTNSITVSGIATSNPDLAIMCTWTRNVTTNLEDYSLTGSQIPWVAYNNSTNASGINASCAAGVIPASVTNYSFRFDNNGSGLGMFSSVVGIKFNTTAPSLPVPTFSAVTGATYATQTVTITDSAATAICYTTDGSIPIITNGTCQHGSLYSTAVSVNYGSSVMAVAWKLGFSPTMPMQYAYDASKLFRGISSNTFTSASTSVTFPSGSVAGDTCIIVLGDGTTLASTPSGWALYQAGTISYHGYFLVKNLTSTDISTGSVTVTMSGTGHATWVALDQFGGHTYNTGANNGSSSGGTALAISSPPLSSGLAGNLVLINSSSNSHVAGNLNRGTLQASFTDGQSAATIVSATVLPSGYSDPVIYKSGATKSGTLFTYQGWIAFSN